LKKLILNSFLKLTFLIFVFFFIYSLIYKSGGDTILTSSTSSQFHISINKHINQKNNILISYFLWLKKAISFEFGKSLITNKNVNNLIKPVLINSFLLNCFALAITLFGGVFIGILSTFLSTKFSKLVEFPLFILFAIPDFLLSVILLTIFAFTLHLFPSYGVHSLNYNSLGFFEKYLDLIHHLILPAIALSATSLVFISRFTKTTFSDTKDAIFVNAMISRGVSSKYILKAIFKNTLFPFISLLSILIPSLISGSVIVESIFSFPGIGLLFYKSILSRDYPVVLAIAFINTIFVFAGIFISNSLYKKANRENI